MLRAAVLHLPVAICSVVALASVADAQMPSMPGTERSPFGGAEKLSYGVDAGIGETDNVTFARTNKVNQTIAMVHADFDVKHQSRRLDVDAIGNFTDFAYLQGAYGNQLIGRFDGVAHVALIPQRLTWLLQDDFGQAALDPYGPTTPGNLESINYFSTGPDLALRVGNTGFVDMGLRYSRVQYQTSPFSNNRVLGNVAAGRQLSARSNASMNVVAERVLFDNTVVNGNFNRTSGYVRYDTQGARTALSVDLGATKVSQKGSPSSPVIFGQSGSPVTGPAESGQRGYSATGPLARISLSRKMSSAATLTLSAGRELTDASSSFSGAQSGALGAVGSGSAVLTSSSYTSNVASMAWQYKRNRTAIGISGHWEKDVFKTQPQFDMTRGGLELNVARKLTRALAAQVFGRYYRTNYVHGNLLPLLGSPKYDEAIFGAGLSWRHGRAMEVRCLFEHSARTTPGVDFGYQENRVLVTVGYHPDRVNDRPLEPPAPSDDPGM